jgi:hypothetical protein
MRQRHAGRVGVENATTCTRAAAYQRPPPPPPLAR